jgi:hypothetical protein
MRSRYGNMIYVQAKYFLSEQMKSVSSKIGRAHV